mgnify:CR=1 FL=1
MPLPKFSSRYPDVREVFDFALAQGGARYTLDSHGKAVHWRSRAYAFRKVLWGEINPSGGNSPTPYDAIKITIDGSTCVIHLETASGRGKLEPLQNPVPGGPVTASEILSAPKKEGFLDEPFLEEQAEKLRKDLGIDL